MNIKIVVIVYSDSLYCIHYSIKIKYMYTYTNTNVNFN